MNKILEKIKSEAKTEELHVATLEPEPDSDNS
jgi:hypothetical protein